MKPTIEQHNDFLAHRPVPGVEFEHNEYVRVVSGGSKGNKGSLVSILEIEDDPVFLLELESGLDVEVRQSEIERG